MFCNGTTFKKERPTLLFWGRIQDEILYALPEECKSYKGLELDGSHIRVWYYLLVVLFRQAAPLLDMSCTNPDHPSRPARMGFSNILSPCNHAETAKSSSFQDSLLLDRIKYSKH